MGNDRISELLLELQMEIKQRSLSLRELIDALQERGSFFVILLLSVPFLQPVALPGVSTPFGILIALLAVGVLVGRDVPLPDRLLRFQLSARGVTALFRGAIFLFRRLEKWTRRNRLAGLVTRSGYRRFHALLILFAALLLTLPLPIPFSNSLPAYVVFFTTLGYLQRDGALFFLAYGFAVLTAAYFASIAFVGLEGLQLLVQGVWG
jgi:hypothetical protein